MADMIKDNLVNGLKLRTLSTEIIKIDTNSTVKSPKKN